MTEIRKIKKSNIEIVLKNVKKSDTNRKRWEGKKSKTYLHVEMYVNDNRINFV